MGIKIGNLDNEKGKAKIGNDIENSNLDSESLDIEVGDIKNADGELDVGNKLKGVKARKAKVWALALILGAITTITGYFFKDSIIPQNNEPTEEPKQDTTITDEIFN